MKYGYISLADLEILSTRAELDWGNPTQAERSKIYEALEKLAVYFLKDKGQGNLTAAFDGLIFPVKVRDQERYCYAKYDVSKGKVLVLDDRLQPTTLQTSPAMLYPTHYFTPCPLIGYLREIKAKLLQPVVAHLGFNKKARQRNRV